MGDRIRMQRHAREMTQQQLADRLEVTKATVSAWETGYAENIRLKTALKLVDEFRVSLRYLVHGRARP